MCGFGGMAQVRCGVDERLVRQLGTCLYHRGPDLDGVAVHGDAPLGVGLATCRLAILDLSPAGSQPMATPDKQVWIAYNGELYNEPALRASLEAAGCRYRSRSDTETVLYAYERFGLDAFHRLNGMYALAIHDRRANRLVLARDRMGIKPLYYARHGDRLVFSSELRALRHDADIGWGIDDVALGLYLICGFVPSPHSLIRGVRKLPPGSTLVLDADGRMTVDTFWRPTLPAPSRLSRPDAAAAVRETIRGAVRRQMRSDVPVGVLLSGGVDSTIVATVAAEEAVSSLSTFSIGFTGANSPIEDIYNLDARFARQVAAGLGATHHEVTVDERDDLPGLLGRLIVGLDEPVWEASFTSIFLMSRLAREHGVKVLLTGDGSDELFAGYPWIAAAWRQDMYERIPFVEQLLPLLTRLAPASSAVGAHARSFQGVVGTSGALRYERLHAVFSDAERRALLGDAAGGANGALAALVEPLLAGARGRSTSDQLALLDLALWVREHFNQRVDRMTMLNSVEARVPFQDDEVVELALSLPFWTKAPFGRPKQVLREAFRGVIPEAVLRRPKRPFAAPQWAWGRGTLRAFANDTLSEERIRAVGLLDPAAARRTLTATDSVRQDTTTFKLWSLVMLQLWAEGAGLGRGTVPADTCATCSHREAPATLGIGR